MRNGVSGAHYNCMLTMGWHIIGLFCKRALQKRLYSAKETYNLKEPTSRRHLIRDTTHVYRTRLIHTCHDSHSFTSTQVSTIMPSPPFYLLLRFDVTPTYVTPLAHTCHDSHSSTSTPVIAIMPSPPVYVYMRFDMAPSYVT